MIDLTIVSGSCYSMCKIVLHEGNYLLITGVSFRRENPTYDGSIRKELHSVLVGNDLFKFF